MGPAAPFRGGIAQFTDNMAKHLSLYHEVSIFTFIQQYPSFLFPGKNQRENAPLPAPSNLLQIPILTPYNLFTWKKTVRAILEKKPDVLLIKFWIPFFCPAYIYIIHKLKKLSNIKIHILCHNIEFHEKWLFSDFFVSKMLKKADKVIVLSENVFSQARKFVPSHKIKKLFHPMYNIEPSTFTPQESFRFLDIPDKPSVLFIGNIKPYKGLDILLRAIPIVQNIIPDLQFIIAGEIYGNNSIYKKYIPQDDTNIIFRNQFIPINELQHYLNIASVVVAPYRTASQSGIVQIAFSYLKPVIAANIPGLKEMIIENKTGYLFKSEDINELANKIIDFFRHKGSINYKEFILENNQNYTWERFISLL